MKRPTHKRRFVATEGIPGVCREDEVVIVDPQHEEGILVARWIPWSDLPHVMEHLSSLQTLDEDNEPASHLSLVTDWT